MRLAAARSAIRSASTWPPDFGALAFMLLSEECSYCADDSGNARSAAYFACMQPVISVANLSKTYASGFKALKNVDLEIRKGEIFALLGPNGAGKTTLISIICGIVNPSEGSVLADGHDVVREYRAARSQIGRVPQVLNPDPAGRGRRRVRPAAAASARLPAPPS